MAEQSWKSKEFQRKNSGERKKRSYFFNSWGLLDEVLDIDKIKEGWFINANSGIKDWTFNKT